MCFSRPEHWRGGARPATGRPRHQHSTSDVAKGLSGLAADSPGNSSSSRSAPPPPESGQKDCKDSPSRSALRIAEDLDFVRFVRRLVVFVHRGSTDCSRFISKFYLFSPQRLYAH